MREFLESVIESGWYQGAMLFLVIYPVGSAIVWIAGSLTFHFINRSQHQRPPTGTELVPVTVVIPAHNEELVIGDTLTAVRALDWPHLEIMVVDDGSTDSTFEVIRPHLADKRIRVMRKKLNEGKAMALNDALPLVASDFVLILDADGSPAPDVLRHMVPPLLREPGIAAITGNPQVSNTPNLLTKLQAIEFASTVAVMRRAQCVWGSVLTFSGLCTILRKSAVEEVGRFYPDMSTEDISMAWQLQASGYGIVFEPRAIFNMQVPETFPQWWSQRKRWALGLGQVLRRHHRIFLRRKSWPMVPVWIEASITVVWCHMLIAATVFLLLAAMFGLWGEGNSPIPFLWGTIAGIVCLLQIAVGLSLDSRFDPRARRLMLWAPLYPLLYWWLCAITAVRGTFPGILKKPTKTVTWNTERIERKKRSPAAGGHHRDAPTHQ